MAERSCRPAFSLPFHGLVVARQIDFSDEVPDQFNLLPAVSAGLIRRMDDNLLYKLINDGVSGVTFDRPAGRSEP